MFCSQAVMPELLPMCWSQAVLSELLPMCCGIAETVLVEAPPLGVEAVKAPPLGVESVDALHLGLLLLILSGACGSSVQDWYYWICI